MPETDAIHEIKDALVSIATSLKEICDAPTSPSPREAFYAALDDFAAADAQGTDRQTDRGAGAPSTGQLVQDLRDSAARVEDFLSFDRERDQRAAAGVDPSAHTKATAGEQVACTHIWTKAQVLISGTDVESFGYVLGGYLRCDRCGKVRIGREPKSSESDRQVPGEVSVGPPGMG